MSKKILKICKNNFSDSHKHVSGTGKAVHTNSLVYISSVVTFIGQKGHSSLFLHTSLLDYIYTLGIKNSYTGHILLIDDFVMLFGSCYIVTWGMRVL